jgi:hypothetical protein
MSSHDKSTFSSDKFFNTCVWPALKYSSVGLLVVVVFAQIITHRLFLWESFQFLITFDSSHYYAITASSFICLVMMGCSTCVFSNYENPPKIFGYVLGISLLLGFVCAYSLHLSLARSEDTGTFKIIIEWVIRVWPCFSAFILFIVTMDKLQKNQ